MTTPDELREQLRGMALSLATGSGPIVEPAAFDAALDAYRAAVLREEADRIDATRTDFPIAVQNGITWATAELRRMAGETATETPFTPPAHYRRDDGVDCCVHTIPVGPGSCPACREPATNKPAGPTVVDLVVAALQAKAQALSAEAEEEMRRDLEEKAQVWHEAADLARRTSRKAARTPRPASA
ncbi:hypothetical protein ACWGKO_16325 [Streptomyces griseoincarnatus]